MKTKPVRRLTLQLISVSAVALLASGPVFADKYDDAINSLKQTIAGHQAEINGLQGQKDTLTTKLAILNAQIANINDQLELASAQYDKTVFEIETAKQQLADKKAVLGENLKIIYYQGRTTPLEMLVASGNISDYYDQQRYLDDVKDRIQQSIESINALKARLDAEQQQLVKLIADQKALKFGLAQQRAQSNQLLAETEGVEANYQSKIAADNSQIAQLKRQQAAEIASRSRRISGGGPSGGAGCGGYPSVWCHAYQDSLVDDWGFYNRECTSYAAWKRSAMGRPLPAWGRMGYADAKTWIGWAAGSGYSVDGNPRPGDVAVYTGGRFGHVGIVESVSGGKVVLSNFNASLDGTYSIDEWSVGSLQYIH